MDTFADYVLEETNLVSKIEIIYYLSKKAGIYFDKSIILKAEIVRQFVDYMKIDVDKNCLFTACLLCNCKKTDNPQELGKVRTYAQREQNTYLHWAFLKDFVKYVKK